MAILSFNWSKIGRIPVKDSKIFLMAGGTIGIPV